MRRLGIVLYCVALAGVGVMAYRKPLPTFDRLMYAATVAHLHSSDRDSIAKEAFRLSPPGEYPRTPFTEEVLHDPEAMVEQIPFYAIRPLYVRALDLFGLRAVSPLAYVALGGVLFYWLRNPWWCLGLMLLPDVVMACRTITPDALSTLVVLGAMLLIQLGKDYFALALLLVGLSVRTDNLFFLGALLLVLVFRRRIGWPVTAGVGILGVVIVLAISHSAHEYGWALRMRGLVTAYARPAQAVVAPLTAREYLVQLLHGSIGTVGAGFALWIMLGAVAWMRDRKSRDFLFVAALYSVVHIVVFPISEVRYFIPAYVLVGVCFAQAMLRPDDATGAPPVPTGRPRTSS